MLGCTHCMVIDYAMSTIVHCDFTALFGIVFRQTNIKMSRYLGASLLTAWSYVLLEGMPPGRINLVIEYNSVDMCMDASGLTETQKLRKIPLKLQIQFRFPIWQFLAFSFSFSTFCWFSLSAKQMHSNGRPYVVHLPPLFSVYIIFILNWTFYFILTI